MFNLLDKIVARRHPLKSIDDVRRELEAEANEKGLTIAARYTRGNTAIQMLRMITSAPKLDIGALHPRLRAMLRS